MSTQAEKSVKDSVKELAIVKAIMEKLQLGDEGKIGSFFTKQVKSSEKAIRDLNRNITTLKNRYDDDVQDLEDKIQDAQEALVDAYQAVTPEDVPNNAAMAEFADTYWYNVGNAKAKVERLVKELEGLEEDHKKSVEKYEKEVAAHKERINYLKTMKNKK